MCIIMNANIKLMENFMKKKQKKQIKRKIVKLGKYNMTKERIIIITNSTNNISLKKTILIEAIIGFTISKIIEEFITYYRDLENDFNHIAKNSFEINL